MKLFPNISWRALFGPRRTTPAQRRAVLRLVAVAVEQRVELAPLLEAWAREEWGGQPRRLRRLAATLRQGVPLPDAVERHPGVLGDEDTLLVRFGAESGTLVDSAKARLQEPFDPAETGQTGLRHVARYAVMLLLVLTPIVLFIQVYLLPSMQAIWSEFSLEAPTAAMSTSSFIAGVVFKLFTFLVVLFAVAMVCRLFGWPGRWLKRAVAPRVFSPLRTQRLGGVLRLLSDAALAGRPMAGAISTLARYHYDPAIRRKLLFVRNEVALGVDPWTASEEARLITASESAAATAAVQPGVLGWTLKTLGDQRCRGSERTLRRLAAVLFPLVIFLFGAFVLSQTLGLFVPLVQLTEVLC